MKTNSFDQLTSKIIGNTKYQNRLLGDFIDFPVQPFGIKVGQLVW